MARGKPITPVQRQRERAVAFALYADIALVTAITFVAVASGSLTMGAEMVRTILMVALELISLLAMRRIHRGLFSDFEFGHGKIEQFANMGIALGLLIGGVLIFVTAVGSLLQPGPALSPFALAVAASVSAVNTWENFVAWVGMRRAAKTEANAMLTAQLRTRWVKLVSSVVVQVVLTIAALTYDPLVAHWLDAAGAMFVTVLMILTALDMLRGGLPDLLDRGVDEAAHLAILRALSSHFDSYARFYGVRTRRSSGQVFVEVELGYPADLSLAEIDRRRLALEAGFREELGDCDVTVRIHGEPPVQPAAAS